MPYLKAELAQLLKAGRKVDIRNLQWNLIN
jgi:hypothetical protein